MRYRFVGATPRDLADGRPVVLGDPVSLTRKEADHPHNAALVADGLLVPIRSRKESAPTVAPDNKENS